ncbi:MAG TPA: AAA family ATPase [Nostocaceae cyanobacterium]|nr:AAA family ATPase [Nostocaceae cyanobacterium]
MLKTSLSISTIPGYHINEVIYKGNRTIVYRGEEEKSQKPVVIKTPSTSYPQFHDLVSLKNQFNIIQLLDHPNIIKCYSLETYNNSYALILEDFQAISLSEYIASQTLDLQEFLYLGIEITKGLDYLYQKKIIHKDIKPRNILINPKTKQVKIIDFSISSLLTKETAEIKNPNVLEGTLAYMSPEQTGRMNRGIDYRSDFYSLGVTFYQLLIEQLPFNSHEPLELVHCHLAKEPINPREINPQIPQVVADIILKLMAKTAEQRYQTAKGIKHDLETCQKMLLEQGEITAFELAQTDKCDRFLIPEKLYGRETEASTLLNVFEQVTNGSKELILVSGYSGIGKTAVVNEVHKPIVRQKGYFISGKYDQFQRNIPFYAILQAFNSLIQQLLTENREQLQAWKTKILAALGEQAGVIIEVIPELEKIIGQQPEITEITDSTAQNRFNLLFIKFIQVLATKEHPLVIFLDDVQWADAASLKLIQLLMTENEVKYLLLICAYRDNEVNTSHPFTLTLDHIRQTQIKVNQITLKPLDEYYLNLLISDTLGCSTSQALPLTKLIFEKTQGNPFFTSQLLKSLYEEGLIIFNHSQTCWQFNINEIQALKLNNNIVDFLKLKLQKLPKSTQNILKIAACIGNQFDLETLSTVSETSQAETANYLWSALKEEIILPQNEVYKLFTNEQLVLSNTNSISINESEQIVVRYRFLHDRVQQAAYSLIPDSDKKATHLKIGQILLQNTQLDTLEENIFDIVNQLNIGKELITDQSSKYELAKLNLLAGKKAKSATAYEVAAKYLKAGLEFLEKDGWKNQYKLTLNIYVEIAEVHYLSGQFAQAKETSTLAIKKAKTILDQIKLYQINLLVYIAQNLQQEAVNIGMQLLEKLGLQFPKKANTLSLLLAVAQTKLTLFGKQPEDLLNLPNMTDPHQLATVQLLSLLAPTASQAGSPYFPLIILAIVRLSVKYGSSSAAAFGYTVYGGMLCDKLGDIAAGYRFGKVGIKILDQTNDKSFKPKTHYLFNAIVRHFKEPIKDISFDLDEVINLGLEIGDIEFASYACMSQSSILLLSGKNLELVEQKTNQYLEIVQNLKLENPVLCIRIIRQTIITLQSNFLSDLNIDRVFQKLEVLAKIKNTPISLSLISSGKTLLYYFYHNYQAAIKNAELTEVYHPDDPGFLHYSVTIYYHSLALLAQCKYASLLERKQYLKQVATNQKKMKMWAEHSPGNFQHKYDLVEAEKARVLGKNWLAVVLYNQAIKEAKENGYIQEEAIANELTAKFYLTLGQEKTAQTYLIDAYYCYKLWGANAKLEDLENNYPKLLKSIQNSQKANINVYETHDITSTSSPLSDSTSTSSNISAMLDLETVTKAALAISSEIHVDKLIYNLMQVILENVGADQGSLILQQDHDLIIVAQCQNTQQCELPSIPVNTAKNIPTSLINYVYNTREDVIVNDATIASNFVNDSYIIQYQPKSILCTPILNQGKLIGIIYLENTLTVGVFTPERLKILKLLSSQAAISLENAQLYANLEEKVNIRTQELNEKNLQIQQTLQDLKQAQTQLIQTEKMSSLGQMVAGVAHEINNPINFISANIKPTSNYFHDLVDLVKLYQQEYPQPSEIIQEKIEEIDLDFITQDSQNILNSMKTGADRIRNIILGLRNFSRLDEAEMKPVDIHEGIENTLMLLQSRFRDKLGSVENVVIKDYAHLPLVNCYASQLNQVFMNILNNAIDVLSKRNRQLSLSELKNNSFMIIIRTQLLNDNWVRISFKDNGLGMTEEVKKRIFDPFFTTKDVGEGTGLGLSISYQIIVDKHHGKIDCISQPGEGAEFIIDIPIN